MDWMNLPVGYCFRPTAEQLLMQYLLPRKNNKPVPGGDRLIKDVNLYGKNDPWTLFGVTDGSQKCQFFVFTDLKKLYKGDGRLRWNGRKSRTAGSGFWRNRAVNDVKDSEGKVIGLDRYYTFCTAAEKKKSKPKKGRWYSGSNTDDEDDDDDHGHWTMHEYSLVDSKGRCFDDLVVCAIACNSQIIIKHSAAPGNSKNRRMSAVQSSTELGETSLKKVFGAQKMSNGAERHRIGYALEPKKVQSFIKPSLLYLASERGIDLIRIDPEQPLSEQGPFDCIIHKLYGQDWKLQLREFSAKNPNVPVIDSPDSIEKLHNRISMLSAVTKLQSSNGFKDFGIPNQVAVFDKEGFVDSVRGLKFPVVAKHLMADGSPDSHKMLLVFDKEGLDQVDTPVVLQEFVNHGGFIFKVYVVGKHVTCVKRKSLPDISEEKLKTLKGSISFSQISNLATSSTGSDELNDEKSEMPPLGFVVEFAMAMGEALGLNLFNFDVIRDAREEKNRYLVIDINYFPGYAKMPSFQLVLTDFFLEIVHKKKCKETGEVADDNSVDTKLELCAGKW